MFRISRKNIFVFILWFITIILFIFVLYFYFIRRQNAPDIFLNLLGVFAMLSIALQTFITMDRSTKETIHTLLETSQKQIEEFKSFIVELKNTNITLEGVSKSLKTVADDVISRQKLIPNLYVTFIKNQNQIDLRAGEVCEIEFYLHNSGVINASNPHWSIFLPPQIEVVDRDSFNLVQQGAGTRHENFIMLAIDQHTINAKTQIRRIAKIKTLKTNVGIIEIPFACSCDNAPQSADKLLINFIG